MSDLHEAFLESVNAAIDRLTFGVGESPSRDEARSRAPRYRRIVVAYDGSEGAKLALDWAKELARAHSAKVTVVTVFTPPQVASAYSMGLAWYPDYAQAYHDIEHSLREASDSATELLRAFDVQADGVVVTGSPAHEVVEAARTHRADLVIAGATRGGRVARLFGSTAQALLASAPCSVLIARGQPRPRRILVATDGSRASYRAVAHALHRASQTSAELVVQHVLEVPAHGAEDAPPEGFVKSVVERMDLPAASPKLRYVIDVGNAATRILQRVVDEDAGLVVVGSHGKGALDRLFVGSTSRRVAAESPASVLVVKDVRP